MLAFLYFYLLLIMGAFGSVVAGLLANPAVPIGFILLTLAGMLAGQMTYRWKMDMMVTTVVTVLLALLGIYLGTLGWAKDIVGWVNGLAGDANGVLYNTPYGPMNWSVFFWGIFALLFCYLGSVLPIWRFAQPVNYVSFWFVALGMIGSILGVAIATFSGSVNTALEIPAFVTWNQPHLGWLWPILFVTISCGAVSGWHSLVSTSGTARQLEKETDALPVGGGAMFTEAVLGVLSVVFAATALKIGDTVLYDAGANYKLSIGAGGVFAQGMSRFLNVVGIPAELGGAIGSIFLAVMALTVMQLVLRFMRVASAELLGDRIPVFKNPHIGSLVAIGITLLILWTAFWQRIWVLFGGANQLFAGLSLLLIAIWLAREGKQHAWAYWPGVFMYVTTVAALLVTAWSSFFGTNGAFASGDVAMAFRVGNGIAGLIGLFLGIAAVILAVDGMKSFSAARSKLVATAGD